MALNEGDTGRCDSIAHLSFPGFNKGAPIKVAQQGGIQDATMHKFIKACKHAPNGKFGALKSLTGISSEGERHLD